MNKNGLARIKNLRTFLGCARAPAFFGARSYCSPIVDLHDCTTDYGITSAHGYQANSNNASIKFDEIAKRTYIYLLSHQQMLSHSSFLVYYFNVLVSAYQILVSTLLIFSSPCAYCLDFLPTTSFHRCQLPRNSSDLQYSWDPRGSGSERLKASLRQPSSQRTDGERSFAAVVCREPCTYPLHKPLEADHIFLSAQFSCESRLKNIYKGRAII